MVAFDPQVVEHLARELTSLGHGMRRNRQGPTGSEKTADRRFQGWFGIPATVAVKCWLLLKMDPEFDRSVQSMKWLLWAFMLLKDYYTEEEMTADAENVDKKTFRKHAWDYVFLLSDLETQVVSFPCCCFLYFFQILTFVTHNHF